MRGFSSPSHESKGTVADDWLMSARRTASIVLFSFILGGALIAAGVEYLRPPRPSTVSPIELQAFPPGGGGPEPSPAVSGDASSDSNSPGSGSTSTAGRPSSLSGGAEGPQDSVVRVPGALPPAPPAPAGSGSAPPAPAGSRSAPPAPARPRSAPPADPDGGQTNGGARPVAPPPPPLAGDDDTGTDDGGGDDDAGGDDRGED